MGVCIGLSLLHCFSIYLVALLNTVITALDISLYLSPISSNLSPSVPETGERSVRAFLKKGTSENPVATHLYCSMDRSQYKQHKYLLGLLRVMRLCRGVIERAVKPRQESANCTPAIMVMDICLFIHPPVEEDITSRLDPHNWYKPCFQQSFCRKMSQGDGYLNRGGGGNERVQQDTFFFYVREFLSHHILRVKVLESWNTCF